RRPALFPYTTLFRSPRQRRPGHAHGGRQVGSAAANVVQFDEEGPVRVGRAQAEGVEGVPVPAYRIPDTELAKHSQGVALQRDPGDRKSTRLNSSHVE